ncbi:hypothetical protein [Alkalicella caledoniensis]|nr:hypothetical protein [Alkalicella caledoniensis]
MAKEVVDELRDFQGKYEYIPCNVQSKNDVEYLWHLEKHEK